MCGAQVSFRVSPQSRLHVCGVLCIQIASRTRLFTQCGSVLRTCLGCGTGYPRRVISRNLKKRPRQQDPTTDEDDTNTKPPSLFLPYVQGLSEKLQTARKKIGVRTVFKSNGTLRQLLTRVKTKTPELKKRGVVYRIPCRDCEAA